MWNERIKEHKMEKSGTKGKNGHEKCTHNDSGAVILNTKRRDSAKEWKWVRVQNNVGEQKKKNDFHTGVDPRARACMQDAISERKVSAPRDRSEIGKAYLIWYAGRYFFPLDFDFRFSIFDFAVSFSFFCFFLLHLPPCALPRALAVLTY